MISSGINVIYLTNYAVQILNILDQFKACKTTALWKLSLINPSIILFDFVLCFKHYTTQTECQIYWKLYCLCMCKLHFWFVHFSEPCHSYYETFLMLISISNGSFFQLKCIFILCFVLYWLYIHTVLQSCVHVTSLIWSSMPCICCYLVRYL